ncbi:ABC transporter permease [Caulobacter mirabilis]|uniref:Peptide ABC transporter permease n=1 Tax=Caulobacter mirabilis TaxID=69666 RepID=A0A2D2AWB1_9CAUL|nr:ABC transporter permease [Caulobacter mirabilis]ATQ42261.1 peptide ABC transporter permease [Caulobacter mirabilis]
MTSRARPYGVPLGEVLREAFANLLARGQRSGLALLGIVVGTASIIAMLNIGHVAQLETMKQFERLGIDTIQVRSTPNGGEGGFPKATIEDLPKTVPGVVEATPYATAQISGRAGGKEASLFLIAAPPSLAPRLALTAQTGRLLTAFDDCAPVGVIGAEAAQKLARRPADMLGQQVALGSYLFTVVGVLEAIPSDGFSVARYNDAFMIPQGCARRVLPSNQANAALVRVADDADVDRIDGELKRSLTNRTTLVQTTNAKSIIVTMNRQKGLIAAVLAAIGGISLLVGGIGVMNVMLMNVLERRREIGLRAAIGATPKDIQLMFVAEAAMLAAAGGLVGAILGLLLSALAVKLFSWDFAIAYHLMPIGPLGSGVIGVLFGLYPALSASRIDPIEALRAD